MFDPNMSKRNTLLCLIIGWSINLGMAVLHAVRGDMVSPWLVVCPEAVLVMIYARELKKVGG